MITQVISATPFGVAALSIVALLVLIILLIQCGGNKDKESRSQDGSIDDGAYERIISPGPVDNSNGNKLTPECKVVVEAGKEGRSSTLASSTSNQSNSMERPRQPTPLPERKPTIEENHNESNFENSILAEGQVRVELETTCATAPSQDEVDGNCASQKSVVATEGSYETSGDSLYTKVKPVAPKPECAYSVVEISNKDTEYEMVGGKVQRKATENKEAKDKPSEYEVFNVERKPDLDPVLFAVEDSGASGIYEDVPDNHIPKVIMKEVAEGPKVIDQPENKEPDRLEEPKKKWGLTRFSLIKKHNKNAKDKKDSHEQPQGSPNMADKSKRKSHGSMESLTQVDGGSPRNQGKENHKRSVSSRSPRGRNEGDALPPPPPQENLRFKAENRRTLHMGEHLAEPTPTREPPRRQSGPDVGLAKRPLAGVPNFYTTDLPSDADIIDGDTVYEVPDQDPSAARKKVDKWQEPRGHEPNSQQSGKWRSGSAASPNMAHREVPKPPPLEVKLAMDDIETDETYDTISSTMNFEGEADSASIKAVSSTDPKYEKVRKLPAINDGPNTDSVDGSPGKVQATEPPYAVVDRALANKGSVRKLERQLSGGDGEPPRNGGKIEVIMRRTTISSDIRGKNEAPVKHVITDSEIRACEAVPDESANDTIATPVDLDALYSKVDLNKKREEEEKRALYSTPNVVKTGIKTFYYGDENETIKEEFDDGHYTRITEGQASNASSLGRQKELATSDYETIEEQKTMAMFTHIRPATGIPRSSMQVNANAKVFTKKSDSDYEDINSFSAKMETRTKTTKPRVDDYEEIPVSPSKKEQPKNPGCEKVGYETIGYETIGNEKPKPVTKRLSADNLRQSNRIDGPKNVRLPSRDYEEITDPRFNEPTGTSPTTADDVFDVRL